jgi:hypothetical protein
MLLLIRALCFSLQHLLNQLQLSLAIAWLWYPTMQISQLHVHVLTGWRLSQLPMMAANWKSESPYWWRFTANQFLLASSHLRPKTRIIFQLNHCGNSPYITSSHEKMGLSLMNMLGLSSSVHFAHIACYWKNLPFTLHTHPLLVQALQTKSCLSYVS